MDIIDHLLGALLAAVLVARFFRTGREMLAMLEGDLEDAHQQ